jgi:uncharacterized SAM-binding protein YcdF (DUF218 family)
MSRNRASFRQQGSFSLQLGVLICAPLLPAMIYMAAIKLAVPLLSVSEPHFAGADTIVVLGGDGPSRAAKTVQVWQDEPSRHVLVSGDGDCMYIRQALLEGGVPADIIETECRSGTTWDNAAYSAPLLNAMRTQSAILVTNWFHMRRAIARFRETCPNIRWSPEATEPPTSIWTTATGPYGPAILKEYPKLAVYTARGVVQRLSNRRADDKSSCRDGVSTP